MIYHYYFNQKFPIFHLQIFLSYFCPLFVCLDVRSDVNRGDGLTGHFMISSSVFCFTLNRSDSSASNFLSLVLNAEKSVCFLKIFLPIHFYSVRPFQISIIVLCIVGILRRIRLVYWDLLVHWMNWINGFGFTLKLSSTTSSSVSQ